MTRILLVDDSGEVRRSMRAVLAEMLADVTFGDAADAAGALAALDRESVGPRAAGPVAARSQRPRCAPSDSRHPARRCPYW